MDTSKKQILYLSIDGMTDALGQSQVLPYLIGLRKLGWEITLISAEKPNRMLAYGEKIRTICSKGGIEWRPFTYHSGIPIVSAFYNFLNLQRIAFREQRVKDFSLVHCRSYIPGLVGLKLKTSHGISFLFDIRGLWVDEKIDGHIWKLNNPVHRQLYKYFKKKEKELFNGADTIVSLTEKAKKTICVIGGTDKILSKIHVIPCCVETTHFDPTKVRSTQQDSWRMRLGIGKDDRFLVYLGSLSTWYLPRQMFSFYKSLERSIPGLRLLIVSGESPEPFLTMLKDEGIGDNQVIFTSSQRDELPALLSLAEFSICFYQTSFSRQATSPTKLAELMSMGIPIVCSDNVGDVNEILRKTGSGAVCDPDNTGTWTGAVEQLIHISNNKSKAEIRQSAIELFDVEIGITRYDEIYRKLSHQA